jgi:hypothetical protein
MILPSLNEIRAVFVPRPAKPWPTRVQFQKVWGATPGGAKQIPPPIFHIKVRMLFLGTLIAFNPATSSFTMIYFTTFILALFLTQIACAQSQTCGDAVSPELSTPDEQHVFIPIPLHATHAKKYDDKEGLLNSTHCPKIAEHYKHFHNIPDFPRIGGAYDIRNNPTNCGACWNITNRENHKSIFLTAIDSANIGFFNISEEAFKLLNKGNLGPPLSVSAVRAPPSFCLHH